LIEQEIPDEISIFEAISEILNAISPAELERVFRNWIERVEVVIAAKGNPIAQ
jgi:hypothetical protein